MAILGVLLGITITVLAAVIVYGYSELKKLREFKKSQIFVIEDHDLRIQRLEAKKAYKSEADKLADALAGASLAASPRPKSKMRTWNEDIGAVGEAQ